MDNQPDRAAEACKDSLPAMGRRAVLPHVFSRQKCSLGAEIYQRDNAIFELLGFFESKGMTALKAEDRDEAWHHDWLQYQADHGIYAGMLTPQQYSTTGGFFNLLRYARFLEVFAYCSAAHGYSLHVSFLGLFAILTGSNDALKRDAVARIERGELLAFGISERGHGSDLMATEFAISPSPSEPKQWKANGSKYYIGNANAASIIAVLGRKKGDDSQHTSTERAPLILVGLRPDRSSKSWHEDKIHTLGVRAAHVGMFDVTNHRVAADDVIAEGRAAWDAVFATVTLGKFFLGFGAIGMCEHAFAEAREHLQSRILYGKSALAMPHIRLLMSQAWCRLLAMKLYAYRALDYVHAAAAEDRRYQLFCAVQKAKVSAEGVKVMALISEAVGAKGFEGDTYCEMAMRDVSLLPGLEGSMHINLALAAQLSASYFKRTGNAPFVPGSLVASEEIPRENAYLMSAPRAALHGICFDWFLNAYRGIAHLPNVVLFFRQAATFRRLFQHHGHSHPGADTQTVIAMGQCQALIAYGQLIAESVLRLQIPAAIVAATYALLVTDMSGAAMQLSLIGGFDATSREMLARMVRLPVTNSTEWNSVAECALNSDRADG